MVHGRASKAEARLAESKRNYEQHLQKIKTMPEGPARRHEEELCEHFKKEIEVHSYPDTVVSLVTSLSPPRRARATTVAWFTQLSVTPGRPGRTTLT